MPFIFISYSHKDSEYANRLAASLEVKGLQVWIDERINYGEAWSQTIEENLGRCAAFVVVMTPDSKRSEWVQNELAYAMSLRKPVFPVLLAGQVWLAVAARQAVSVIDGSMPPASFYSRLAGVLVAGQAVAAPATAVQERLQTELDELQRRYANLTSRIRAVDTDLGRESDGERRLMLEERRTELAESRAKTAARMAVIETQLAQIIEPNPPPAQEKEPEPAIKQPVSTGAEALSATKVARNPPLVGDFVTIHQPVHLDLVHVPAGDFLVGRDLVKDSEGDKDEHPQHRLYLPEFYIGKYPITNAQYAVFVKATGYRRPDEWEKGEIPASEDDHPVVGVSWHDAMAFCRWLASATGLAFRLPTEAQWEKAASWDAHKQQKYKYPWGDEFDVKKCNTNESGIGNTTPVGTYSPVGDSVYGAADMAGNVSEWCSSLHRSYPYRVEDGREDLTASGERVLRGGSWYDGHNFAAASFRDHNSPDGRANLFGVRVVASWSPA